MDNDTRLIEERILELNEGGLEWVDMIDLDEYGSLDRIKEYKALRHFQVADWLSELRDRRIIEPREYDADAEWDNPPPVTILKEEKSCRLANWLSGLANKESKNE